MKKSIIVLVTSILLISHVFAENDSEKYTHPDYKTAVIDDSLNFSASRDGYQVKLQWNAYSENDFQYYKIMRSETHSNPIYPNQNALNFIDDANNTTYELKDWAQKTVNYRVCVITTEKARICSNVVGLSGMEKEDKKEYTDKKVYMKKTNLDANLTKRADKMIDDLVTRLDKKYSDNTDQKEERLNTLIIKLESLNTKIKSEKTKALVAYIIQGLKDTLSEINASDDIENIFNILEEEK